MNLKRIEILCLSLELLLLMGCATSKCSKNNINNSFAFKYENTLTANRIDTFNGSITVDWWMSDSATTNLCFTMDELNLIKDEMRKIHILKYPKDYRPASGDSRDVIISPHPVYYLKVKFDSVIKEIRWDDYNFSNVENAIKLRQLFNKIEIILRSKPKYKNIHRKLRIIL